MIGRKVAEGIIREVVCAIKDWRSIAIRLGISKREMDVFASVLDGRRQSTTSNFI